MTSAPDFDSPKLSLTEIENFVEAEYQRRLVDGVPAKGLLIRRLFPSQWRRVKDLYRAEMRLLNSHHAAGGRLMYWVLADFKDLKLVVEVVDEWVFLGPPDY